MIARVQISNTKARKYLFYSPLTKINAEWDTFCVYFLSKPQAWDIISPLGLDIITL